MSMTRLATIASAVWLLAVFAYGIGYLARLGAGDSGRTLPTLDFMFLAFAAIGPVAMLWVVVVLLRRTETLSEHIAAQGESALALATTVANLNDSIDALSAATQGRLVEACDRIERHAETATAAFQRNLDETGSRLNRVMLESVVLIDERIAGRVDAFEAALERQRASLDQHLRDDSVRLSDALETQATAMSRRLDDDATRLTAAIEREMGDLSMLKASLLEHVRAGLTDSRAQLDDGVSKALAFQRDGLDETNRRLLSAVDTFAATLNRLQEQHAELLDKDIGQPVQALQSEIRLTRQEIAANPPATANQLTDLVAKSAQQILRTDRKLMTELALRVEGLETKAAEMLAQIDRTSRLNPLMDAPVQGSGASAGGGTGSGTGSGAGTGTGSGTGAGGNDGDFDIRDAELPFAELPRAMPRRPVNWGAAIRALDGEAGTPDAPGPVRAAAQDPDLALVLRQSGALAEALAADRVHLEDLIMDHSPALLWHRYGTGARGKDVAALGEVRDEITQALVRARLRSDPEFRALAIRHCAAYGRMLARAATELGVDSKLVEMADTRPGRAFMLLGGMVGAFDPVSDPVFDPVANAADHSA